MLEKRVLLQHINKQTIGTGCKKFPGILPADLQTKSMATTHHSTVVQHCAILTSPTTLCGGVVQYIYFVKYLLIHVSV